MRFSVAAVAGLAAGVSANYNYTSPPVYTTEVVTAYTTYCPGPTSITYGSSTYTVTEATTLTITDCPCTVTYPVTTPTSYPPPGTYVPPPVTSTYVPPPVYTPPPANTSVPVPPPPVTTPPPVGAANRAVVASGAGLAAVFGFVAYVL